MQVIKHTPMNLVSKLLLKWIWYHNWCQIGVKIGAGTDLVSKLVSKFVLKLIWYQNWCQFGVKIGAEIDHVLKLVPNWCQKWC